MGKPKPAYAVWSWGLDDKKQFQTALRDVKEAGFEYFESVSKTIRIFENDVDEFMRVVEREGVYPASFYFPVSGDAGEDRKKIENSLDFLEKAGVRRISLQAPGKKGGGASTAELNNLVDILNGICDICAPAGIRPCLHPHVNTQVMYENEIDHVMGKSKISFGPDTAHLLASGCDPVEMFKRYAGRIGFVHLKDMRQGKPLRVNEKPKEAFEIYVDFLELGEGSINFPAVFDILDEVSYDGFLTVELDESRTTQKESAFKSMAYLKQNLLPRYK